MEGSKDDFWFYSWQISIFHNYFHFCGHVNGLANGYVTSPDVIVLFCPCSRKAPQSSSQSVVETGLVLEKPRTLLHLDLLPPGASGIVGLAHREFFLKKNIIWWDAQNNYIKKLDQQAIQHTTRSQISKQTRANLECLCREVTLNPSWVNPRR